MEVLAPNENIILFVFAIYFLILFISYVFSWRLDNYGVRSKAIINSLLVEEYEVDNQHDDAAVTSHRYKALITYNTKNGESKSVKIPIAKKYLGDYYKKKLPIIYFASNPEKPRIDDNLYIYQWPIILSSLLVISLFILLFVISFPGN